MNLDVMIKYIMWIAFLALALFGVIALLRNTGVL